MVRCTATACSLLATSFEDSAPETAGQTADRERMLMKSRFDSLSILLGLLILVAVVVG
jgi:hypothetical protein